MPYTVVTQELIVAATAVTRVTESAKAATIEDLPAVISDLGHDGLESAFRDFCARWDAGLSHLVGDSETMSRRLHECAEAYLAHEDRSTDAYQALLTDSPTPPWGIMPPVGPIG